MAVVLTGRFMDLCDHAHLAPGLALMHGVRSTNLVNHRPTQHACAAPVASAERSAGIEIMEDPQLRKSLICGRLLFAKQVPLLLQGATGTGKEVFARCLHRDGLWHDKPFVAVNCAAIPENLIESELFGYAGGAFTGAAKEGRIGKVLRSSGGTLFLDEIGDMPLTMQTRLLRVIEEREVAPIGSDRAPIPVDLHVISATHRDLRTMIELRQFREDLYYRLNGFTLNLPLLREREDRPALIRVLMHEENLGQEGIEIDEEAFGRLMSYSWPGNIRQLRNTLRISSALCRGGIIRLSDLPRELLEPQTAATGARGGEDCAPHGALCQAERAALVNELERMRWNVSRTARAIGISRNTLYRKMRKHGLLAQAPRRAEPASPPRKSYRAVTDAASLRLPS